MKPCDCKDIVSLDLLNEIGVGLNSWSIVVDPNSVIIDNQTVSLKIPMYYFKLFAEWYLEDQVKK